MRTITLAAGWAPYCHWLAMRILHVADRVPGRGGAYTWMAGVIDGLAAHHEQLLVAGEGGFDATLRVKVVVRPGLESRTPLRVDLDGVVAEFAPDVVHVHNLMNPVVLEWAAARRRCVLTVQDHRYFCPTRGKWTLAGEVCRRPLSREVCAACFEDEAYFGDVLGLTERRLAAAKRLPLTVLSRYMREELVAAGVAPESVHVVPPFVHGLDLAADPDGPPCVLFVGRLAESKGARDAVKAWRRSGLELPLVLAGTGPLRTELEAARSAGPPLEVLGWVGRRRLSALYQRAAAVVFPPRWQEPFGIVGIEALSFGVPVVAWESGAVDEWHPGPGLVHFGDVAALARALDRHAGRRLLLLPRYERDEAIGRLTALYGKLS